MSIRRPLNVVLASEGKPFFGLFDAKLAVTREDFSVAPDVIVFPCAKIKQVLPDPSSLPREAWQRVIDGQCVVMFDASTDGNVHTAEGSGRLHDYLASAGVGPEQAVYVTQDRAWGGAYQRHAERFGLRRMKVTYFDFFLRSFFRDFESTGAKAFEQRRALFEARTAQRARKYICLNLSPRPAKVLLLAKLAQQGLFDAGYISFGGFDPAKHSRAVSLKVMLSLIADMPGFGPIAGELLPWLYPLTRLDPMLIGEPKRIAGQSQHVKKQAADRRFDEYSESWFTIVTETEMHSRRISEKPLKSLVNFQPSIILGNQGSVALTRALGFESFAGYFDEAYDDEPNDAERFRMVADECLRLCRLPDDELWRLERAWADVLTHNARVGLTELPFVYRDRIDAEMASEIAAVLGLA